MSSSKSGRISNSRIVETNSSGIVTIVIDDDFEPIGNTDDKTDQNDTNSTLYLSSPPNRRPIGVRTPVPTPGSPKFINSENYQNILIKENKTNVIVVNSGSGSVGSVGQIDTPFGSEQTHFSPTSSCCSAQSVSSEVRSQHTIVSKLQPHYVVVNSKPKSSPLSFSATTGSYTSSPSSPSFSSKSSPSKLRLWQPTNQSAPRSPPVVVSTRVRSHTSLPPEDVESDCMDDQTFFKYLNLIPSNKFNTEPKMQLKTEWPLRKVSKIAKPDTNSDGCLLLANFKLIRESIKLAPDMSSSLSERKIRWYREAQQYNERLNKFKANLPLNLAIRERMQSDLEKLHKRLMSDKLQLNNDEERYRRLKSAEQNQRLQRDELKQELDSYSNAFEISSYMGRRVSLSIDNSSLTEIEKFKINLKIDNFCNQKDILSVTVPQNTKLSTRITRSNTAFAGIDKMWGPRSESHEYCFTRKQRLDRYRRLETGLNWKSRLVAMQCRPIDVEVAKITRCPCCLQIVEPEWGHSCRDSDEESLPEEREDMSSVNDSESGAQSENNFNDEEVVSTNSEVITTGNAICYECGKEDCNGDCFYGSQTTVTQISITEPKVESPVPTPVVVFSSMETPPIKAEIEDKIMVQKVPVLHDRNNILINNKINRKSDSSSVRPLNEQNLRTNSDKNVEQSDSDDDIVIINEVRTDITRSQSQPMIRTAEPVMITRFLTPDSDTKPSIKSKFSDKRLRSHSRSNSDEIIVKKIK